MKESTCLGPVYRQCSYPMQHQFYYNIAFSEMIRDLNQSTANDAAIRDSLLCGTVTI